MSSSWGKQSRYGDFEIVGARENQPRLIGEGSFGKTFEAMRQDVVAGGVIKEFVAIKVLNPTLLTSESKRFQFIQELVALTKFKHSNLIHYIRCGEENGEVYYAMELCRGGDLTRLVRRYGPLPERVVALIGLQVSAGLREVHIRHRLVHRDIKPSNIMLVDELEAGLGLQHLGFRFEEQDSLCRIVDFGLVDFTLNAQDVQQRFVGSPMYASPEQIREQPVDGRSDIYSLGMTLWYLLSGRGPLLNPSGEELKDMREAMVRHTLPEEHEGLLPQHLSPAFRQILAKMIAKRPEQRYSSAGELQNVLRQYLSSAAEPSASGGRFTVKRINEPLDTAYVLEGTFPSRLSHRAYLALDKSSGTRVKLNVVADAQRNDAASLESVAGYLSELADLSRLPAFPQALLPVKDVIWASDMLACTEEMVAHVALTDILRARATTKRNVAFSESVSFLRPIAEALDFMIQSGRESIFLPSEEIWLSAAALTANPGDQRTLTQPFSEWQDLEVHFSMLCLPSGQGEQETAPGAGETMSGSLQMSASELHPLPAFARLVYRIINGAEVAAAAGFTPNAYVPAVTLGHASNNLLRDTLWQKPSMSVTALLRELCTNEGVVWRAQATTATGTAGRSMAVTLAASTIPSKASYGAGTESAASATVRVRPDGTVGGMPSPATASNGGAVGSSFGASGTAGASTMGGTAGSSRGVAGSSFASASQASASGSFAGGASGSMDGRGRERICEVISPGIIRSPFDPSGTEQKVPAEQWEPSNVIRCQVTQRIFRLPRKLSPLPAHVVSPGVIQSPYAAAGVVQQVPWDSWMPGGEVVCSESGRRIVLPLELALPEGILPPGSTGVVISPYDRAAIIQVEPMHWEPRAEVVCPTTHFTFALPVQLPPLRALVDAANAGTLASPYASSVTWRIPPEEWTAGRQVICPVTKKPLILPPEVEKWPAEAAVLDVSRRLVSNPFRAGETIQVPAAGWIPGGRTSCLQTGRTVLLPTDLPPLTGELVDNRPGLVRSPFTGEIVQVELKDWVAGAEIACPKSRLRFILPAGLPEWIVPGNVMNLAPGKIRSPHEPFVEVDVPPEFWEPNQVVTCPSTGRRFCLPPELPLLEGRVQLGSPGKVQSPFSSQWQNVPIEEWIAGGAVVCAATGRRFALPRGLDEWLIDGVWVPGSPGRIRSPFAPYPEVDVPAENWRTGGLVVCPATRRRFQLPSEALFPSLALEKAAVDYALAEPEASPEEAAKALAATHAGVTAPQMQAIWGRHRLGTLQDRLSQVQTGEVTAEASGFVRSPYGSRALVKVPPARWIEPGAAMQCSETGRRFVLPGNLPPLVAILKPDEPGTVISPFTPDAPFQVSPEDWNAGQQIRCPRSGQTLRMPDPLPAWNPMGTLVEGLPGTIISPFGQRRLLEVPGKAWAPNGTVICGETGHRFALPGALPPMLGQVVEGRPGWVSSPYADAAEVEVPGDHWIPDAEIACPKTGRAFLLPAELPPLVAGLLEGQPGSVRSPYTGDVMQLAVEQWTPGVTVVCLKTGRQFVLPAELPEWIVPGDVAGLSPGNVWSPYAPHPVVAVPAEQWNPGGVLTCPASGRRFSLPAELPLLIGMTKVGQPGKVSSPFGNAWQDVALDDWEPAKRVVCAATQRPFALPDKLEEWLVEGEWVPGFPGKIHSPFGGKPEVEISDSEWKAGGLLTCPRTQRRFCIPSDEELPPLALEKEAVQFALGEPESDEAKAAQTLKDSQPKATAVQIAAIWKRHGLSTLEERQRSVESGEVIAGEPGFVCSPYGSRPRVEVAPARWMESRAGIRCPETGRRFLLPENLPSLRAILQPEESGMVISPYAPGQPFQIDPALWKDGQSIRCPHTGQTLEMPASLPEWRPCGSAADGEAGTVISPFGKRQPMKVNGSDWVAGASVACAETGFRFTLPSPLPPLLGSLAAGRRGVVQSPYATHCEIQVPGNRWRPETSLTCPETGREFLLPAELPPLPGELIENRPGVARSPYSGASVDVPLMSWTPGAEITCPATGQKFSLPGELPEWIVPGEVMGLEPGKVRSPYDPRPVVDVSPEQWLPGQLVTCPASGRRFALPEPLPLLEGALKESEPGHVESPYSREWQDVALDDWLPGNQLVCAKTGRPFALPARLPEWLADGSWIPGFPGRIASPYRGKPEFDISAEEWKPGGILTCPATKRRFRIPEDPLFPSLELEKAAVHQALAEPESGEEKAAEILAASHPEVTVAQVKAIWARHSLSTLADRQHKVKPATVLPERPGVVRSPYGSCPEVQVAPELWMKPGAGLRCPETGLRFVLSNELPPLQVALVPDRPGMVISPFAPDSPFQVDPKDWVPKGSIQPCPRTQQPLVLPDELPVWKPEAVLVADRPGTVTSPFGARKEFVVKGEEWIAGRAIICPETGWRMTLPAELPPLIAEVLDVGSRLVTSPYEPGCKVHVDKEHWWASTDLSCPRTGRKFLLPTDLPPLTGELVEDQTGVIRSPYSDETMPVDFKDWKSGNLVSCQRTGGRFLLPSALPKWILSGSIVGLPIGTVKSPYEPYPEVKVDPAKWSPNEELTCPATEMVFTLPAELPLLEGMVTAGKPGWVTSPFSNEQQRVSLDDWRPGRMQDCLASGKHFVLPNDLSEWLVDGTWVQGMPGRVRSPFRPNPEMEVPAEQWKPGGLLTCPMTKRRFRVPSEYLFPSLALEKAAVEYALANPETTDEAAAQVLSKQHPNTTPAQIQSIWDRHALGTVEDRAGKMQQGEILADRPGIVRSPYGSHPEVEVPAAQWIERDVKVTCPETRRQFTLPTERPLLQAGVVADDPGMVVSPFAPGQPFQVSPEDWKPGQTIVCQRSRQRLQLPASLPEWNPEGAVKEGQPGTVFSPFGRKLAMKVSGADWVAGGTVVCAHSGHPFLLPQNLPPMTGAVTAGVVGRATSPYAGGEVAVTHKQWIPGGQVTCSQTGRVFLLPATLPVWVQKSFPWALAAVPLVLIVLAGGVFLTPLKNVILHQANPTPAPEVKGTPAKVRNTDSHPAARLEWPQRYVFLQGISPDPKLGSMALVTGSSEKPVTFSKGNADSQEVAVDLAAVLKEKPFADASDLKLKISVPGYESKSIPLKKTSSGEMSDGETAVLRRERIKVRFAGLTRHPFYNSVRFEMTDNALHKPDEEVRTFGLDAGASEEIKSGKYRVTLFRDSSKAPGQDAAIRVADKVLYSEKEFSANGDNSIKVPELTIPQDLAGYTRFEMTAPYFVVRDKAGGAESINGLPHEATVAEWTTSILRFDPSFTKGVLIEESSLSRDYILLTLDLLSHAIFRDHQRGDKYGLSAGDEKVKAEIARFVTSLAPPQDLRAGDPGALLQSRTALFDSAKSVLTALPQHPNNWPNYALLDTARKNCQWFLSLPSDSKQGPKWEAWKRVLGACVGTGDHGLSEADLALLTEKVTLDGQKAEGLFVAQPFTVTSVDGQGTLSVKIDVFLPNMDHPGTALTVAPTAAQVKVQDGGYVLVRELKGTETKVEYVTTALTAARVAK